MSVLTRLYQTRLFKGWMAITGRFGLIQTAVILTLFYVFLVGPVASVTRLRGRDYLDKRPLAAQQSAWRDADSSPPDLERAKLQT